MFFTIKFYFILITKGVFKIPFWLCCLNAKIHFLFILYLKILILAQISLHKFYALITRPYYIFCKISRCILNLFCLSDKNLYVCVIFTLLNLNVNERYNSLCMLECRLFHLKKYFKLILKIYLSELTMKICLN